MNPETKRQQEIGPNGLTVWTFGFSKDSKVRSPPSRDNFLTYPVPLRGGLLGVKTPFFLAIKIRAPLKGPFRGLFGTGPTFTVRGPGNELGASKVQKRATLRPPSAC